MGDVSWQGSHLASGGSWTPEKLFLDECVRAVPACEWWAVMMDPVGYKGLVWLSLGPSCLPSAAVGCLQLCYGPVQTGIPWADGLSHPWPIPTEVPGLGCSCSCPAFYPMGQEPLFPWALIIAQVPDNALDPITAGPQKCFTCPDRKYCYPRFLDAERDCVFLALADFQQFPSFLWLIMVLIFWL